ncbi:MAG: metallophosphoesterase [Clostridiales bacterium]|nr:metallophosphoesterase [Clostridiales bacterium]
MKKTNAIKFNKNGRLVIMQVSDAQDMVHVRRAMTHMLDKAYDCIKPDLVLFTGDNILGNHLLDARIGTRKVADGWYATYERLVKSLEHILVPCEKRGIPFAMIYGNHDDVNAVTKEEHIGIFRRYENCLPMNTDNPEVDCDTYNIPVLSSDGKKTVFNLWMLDSAWHDKETGRSYCEIKPQTTEWFKKTSEELRFANGGESVPSLMFMHVPIKQQYGLLKKCEAETPGAIKDGDGGYVCLDNEKAVGVLGEMPCVCDDDAGLFDAVKQDGSVLALVGGHDHLNSFDGVYDGVRFIQTPCASFRCYGSRERGVRLFVLDENNPAEFETQVFTYDMICGKKPSSELRYFRDADEKVKERIAVIAAGAAAIAAAGIKAAIKKK